MGFIEYSTSLACIEAKTVIYNVRSYSKESILYESDRTSLGRATRDRL